MPLSETVERLIERAQGGEPDAFGDLADLYAPRLFGYLYRLLGQKEEAEDLVQEVFVRVVRTLDRYEHDGRFEAWLFRIATNLARDLIRRRSRGLKGTSFDQLGAGAETSTSSWERLRDSTVENSGAASELSDEVDRLQEAMGRLPDAEREVILMRHYGNMSFQDIADVMGTPLGTALARAHRGLRKLRSWLEGGA